MTPEDERRIDPAEVAELYVRHKDELRSFLVGVLRDSHLANDALQATFAKAVEQGHTAARDSFKAWLFRVALNEALAVRRREQAREQILRRVAWSRPGSNESPIESTCRRETVDEVRAALEMLPDEQRQVVCMRIYDDKTFAAIAKELHLPLGTVLSRMHLAIRKLRKSLGKE